MKIINNDIEVILKKGEVFPYLCPNCKQTIPFIKGDEITCQNCNYFADKEEFTVEWKLDSMVN
jgi:predicted amidophosphoribosyltransferase